MECEPAIDATFWLNCRRQRQASITRNETIRSVTLHPRTFLRKPSRRVVDAFLENQRRYELTYEPVGCTREGSPDGFDCDQYRVQLGKGEAVFAVAQETIYSWGMFPSGWTHVIHDASTVRAEQTVAVLIKVYGLWWLNSARIVYVIDNAERRCGFAYGTLPGHVESGEERFMVEWDEDDAVWYDLRAISRPRHWTIRLGYRLVRRQQRRFARDSQRAMLDATARAQ